MISRRIFTRRPTRLVSVLRGIGWWFAVAVGAIALAGLYAWNNPETPTYSKARQA